MLILKGLKTLVIVIKSLVFDFNLFDQCTKSFAYYIFLNADHKHGRRENIIIVVLISTIGNYLTAMIEEV